MNKEPYVTVKLIGPNECVMTLVNYANYANETCASNYLSDMKVQKCCTGNNI